MKIALASDHGGYEHKVEILKYLKSKGYEVVDYGPFDSLSVDYNDYAVKVAYAIKNEEADRGILVCGTGIGMSIMANKFKGIRAALCNDVEVAQLTRLHNNSNVLCLGGRTTSLELALDITKAWIKTEFSNESRHVRRVNKINTFEEETICQN